MYNNSLIAEPVLDDSRTLQTTDAFAFLGFGTISEPHRCLGCLFDLRGPPSGLDIEGGTPSINAPSFCSELVEFPAQLLSLLGPAPRLSSFNARLQRPLEFLALQSTAFGRFLDWILQLVPSPQRPSSAHKCTFYIFLREGRNSWRRRHSLRLER